MKNHKLTFSLAAAMLWGMFVMMSSMQVFGQGFEFNYGGNGEDQGQAILQTDDRGYLMAGYSESFSSDNDLDVYLIRTDVDGQMIWEKAIDEGFIEHAYGMDATLDGGYIIVGDIRLTALDSFNVYLFKVNLHGDLLWSSEFGGTGFEQGFDVKATSDGGYLIAGRRLNQPNGDLDIYVIKADANGDLVWEQTFGDSGDEEAWGVEEVSDGYMVSGNAINPSTNSSDIYVMKLDFDGNVIWDYYFDYPDTFEQGFGFTLASDGSYVVAGHKGFVDIFVAKLSEDGTTELWNKAFSAGVGGQANDVVETIDGNYVVGGIVEATASNIDLFIAKVDATSGDEIWTHTIGRTSTIDWAESLVERQDGGFALVGWNGQAALVFINDVKLIKADSDGRVRTNYLIGNVYADWNDDNTQDPGEQGMKGWVVEASGDNGSWFGTSDKDGNFYVLVDTGTYDVKVHVKGGNWEEEMYTGYSFPGTYDTLLVNFSMFPKYICPNLFVDLSTDAVVSCENSKFNVTYRNEGTATATGVKVELEVDTDWTFSSASIPVFDQIGDSIYIFEVNDLEAGDEGSFEVILNADCAAEIGTNFFVKAHITPDNICVPATGWDGSSIAVTGSCQGDTVVFELRNVSINPMTTTLDYIVIEDEIMGKTEFQLPGNDVMLVKRYANGSTFRIVSEQTPNHPGKSAPTIAVEGCVAGGGTEFSKGMVTMFPEDEANSFIALDVQESIDPSAAIDLRAYPKGYRGDTIAANVDIEYHVRFQNTTNDTLFWVAVRDSLPLEHLNIATIEPGASSHPYSFKAYDEGVVKFVFDSIVLPPASINPDASKGFIQFKVSQQPDLEPLTEIFNKVLLYVGYDEVPVESTQKRHVIGGATLEEFVEIIVDAKEVPIPGVTVKVYPNPMDGQSTIAVEGMSFNQLDLKVYDAAGRLVRQEKSAGSQITLTKGNLKTGTYFFVLEADGQALKTGKVIVK